MELHNNQVPAGQVWALLVRSRGTYDEHAYVQWYITAEESSADYRAVTAHHKIHGGGTAQRWKITLPRWRMSFDEVTDFVEGQLLYRQGPTECARLLDVSSMEKTKGGGQ